MNITEFTVFNESHNPKMAWLPEVDSITYLATNTLPVVVTRKAFPFLGKHFYYY